MAPYVPYSNAIAQLYKLASIKHGVHHDTPDNVIRHSAETVVGQTFLINSSVPDVICVTHPTVSKQCSSIAVWDQHPAKNCYSVTEKVHLTAELTWALECTRLERVFVGTVNWTKCIRCFRCFLFQFVWIKWWKHDGRAQPVCLFWPDADADATWSRPSPLPELR